jgi:hypothetical protein
VFSVSSVKFCFSDKVAVLVCFAVDTEVAHVKQARVLSQNEIIEIIMDSDSNEEKHYTCEMDEEQPGLPSRWSSITQPASPDFSASSSEDEDVGNVTGQQPQSCVWALPPKPQSV